MVDSHHLKELRKYDLHRTKIVMSTSRHFSQLAPSLRRGRLHCPSLLSTRSCPLFDLDESSPDVSLILSNTYCAVVQYRRVTSDFVCSFCNF